MSAVILGDFHAPYQDKGAVDFAIQVVAALKPKFIVQIGDLYDFFHFSKYPKSMLSFTPGEEVTNGRVYSSQLWDRAKKASPRSKCFQILGNHDERPYKRLLEKAPELEALYDHSGIFRFKGVETILNPKQELILKINGHNTMFLHGHRAKLGDHMLYNQMSTVCGHSHTGGVVYKGYAREVRFELNAGYLADPTKGPLQYGSQNKRYWTQGLGVIDQYGPRFVPFKA